MVLTDGSHSRLDEAKALHAKANRRNLFIKIPGTWEGLPAIEETSASGVPVNVTLLFSREQYEAAAEAYLRGLERRLSAELSLGVHSVASLFVSRSAGRPASAISPNAGVSGGVAFGSKPEMSSPGWALGRVDGFDQDEAADECEE